MKRVATMLAGVLAIGSIGYLGGCAEEVSHKESDKPNMLDNGRTHEEETTYKNPDGSYTTEKSKTRTSN